MSDKKTMNTIRGLAIMAGALKKQGDDPLCRVCLSYKTTIESTRESLDAFIETGDKPPGGFGGLMEDAAGIIRGLTPPEEPVPQRKLGNCAFPGKQCCLKYTRKFLRAIVEPDSQE